MIVEIIYRDSTMADGSKQTARISINDLSLLPTDIVDYYIIETTPIVETGTSTRKLKIEEIKTEGITRIAAIIPALDNLKMINLMVELWHMLNTIDASTEMLLVRDIYVYTKSKITWAKTASDIDLDAYDPATDIGWPS